MVDLIFFLKKFLELDRSFTEVVNVSYLIFLYLYLDTIQPDTKLTNQGLRVLTHLIKIDLYKLINTTQTQFTNKYQLAKRCRFL
jgi:hypothetical protein